MIHFLYVSALLQLQVTQVTRRCSIKKLFSEVLQNSQENACARVSFLIKLQAKTCSFIKKETLVQVFSCEFCKISYRTPPVAASVSCNVSLHYRHTNKSRKDFSISQLIIMFSCLPYKEIDVT